MSGARCTPTFICCHVHTHRATRAHLLLPVTCASATLPHVPDTARQRRTSDWHRPNPSPIPSNHPRPRPCLAAQAHRFRSLVPRRPNASVRLIWKLAWPATGLLRLLKARPLPRRTRLCNHAGLLRWRRWHCGRAAEKSCARRQPTGSRGGPGGRERGECMRDSVQHDNLSP